MPTEKTPKKAILLHLKPPGVAWLDSVAARVGTSRLAVIRGCLAVARRHEHELIKHLEDQ